MRWMQSDGSEVTIPPAMHSAVKALGRDPVHQAAVEFIIDTLCGRHRLSFVMGQGNTAERMAWLEGRRYVGEMIARMIEWPLEEAAEEEDTRRTYELSMTERQERRMRGET